LHVAAVLQDGDGIRRNFDNLIVGVENSGEPAWVVPEIRVVKQFGRLGRRPRCLQFLREPLFVRAQAMFARGGLVQGSCVR